MWWSEPPRAHAAGRCSWRPAPLLGACGFGRCYAGEPGRRGRARRAGGDRASPRPTAASASCSATTLLDDLNPRGLERASAATTSTIASAAQRATRWRSSSTTTSPATTSTRPPSSSCAMPTSGDVLYRSAPAASPATMCATHPTPRWSPSSDAERRAARELGDYIRTQLAVYFARERGDVKARQRAEIAGARVEAFLRRPDPALPPCCSTGPTRAWCASAPGGSARRCVDGPAAIRSASPSSTPSGCARSRNCWSRRRRRSA